jgi:hypothetical protein
MDNPSKTGQLARLCTEGGKRVFPLQGRRPVHEKKEIQTRNWRRDVRAIRHWRSTTSFRKAPWGGISPAGTLLRGGSEEKAVGGATVSVNNFPKQCPPVQIRLPAQAEKVARYLFPRLGPLWGAGTAQIVPPSQHGMGTPKPPKNHSHPACHQPGGHLTVRVHLYRGPVEPPLPLLPATQAQEQSPQDRAGRVLEIGDQLNRQQREGSRAPSAEETGNGNPFVLEDREQLNRITPVGGDLSVAVRLSTDGAGRSDDGGKIDPTRTKRFFVFPNRLTCVRVGKLNRSATLPTGGRSLALTPLGLLPCGSWLFFQGQFLTSEISPSLYHRSQNPVNTDHSTPNYKESNNTSSPRSGGLQ